MHLPRRGTRAAVAHDGRQGPHRPPRRLPAPRSSSTGTPTVSPGPVKTGPWLGDQGVAATVAAAAGGDAADVAKQQAATDRFTRAEEVADVVVLLASGRAGNLTGSDVVIDGGLSTTL